MALESTMLKMEEKNELNFNYSELPVSGITTNNTLRQGFEYM